MRRKADTVVKLHCIYQLSIQCYIGWGVTVKATVTVSGIRWTSVYEPLL